MCFNSAAFVVGMLGLLGGLAASSIVAGILAKKLMASEVEKLHGHGMTALHIPY
jgi:hypothetical protein